MSADTIKMTTKEWVQLLKNEVRAQKQIHQDAYKEWSSKIIPSLQGFIEKTGVIIKKLQSGEEVSCAEMGALRDWDRPPYPPGLISELEKTIEAYGFHESDEVLIKTETFTRLMKA